MKIAEFNGWIAGINGCKIEDVKNIPNAKQLCKTYVIKGQFNLIPEEIVNHAFSFLPFSKLNQIRRVSREWNIAIIEDNRFRRVSNVFFYLSGLIPHFVGFKSECGETAEDLFLRYKKEEQINYFKIGVDQLGEDPDELYTKLNVNHSDRTPEINMLEIKITRLASLANFHIFSIYKGKIDYLGRITDLKEEVSLEPKSRLLAHTTITTPTLSVISQASCLARKVDVQFEAVFEECTGLMEMYRFSVLRTSDSWPLIRLHRIVLQCQDEQISASLKEPMELINDFIQSQNEKLDKELVGLN